MSEKPFSFQTSGKIQQGMQLGQTGIQRFAASGTAVSPVQKLFSDGGLVSIQSSIQGNKFVKHNNHATMWFAYKMSGTVTAGFTNWYLQAPGAYNTSAYQIQGVWSAHFGTVAGSAECSGWIRTPGRALPTAVDSGYIALECVYPTAFGSSVPTIVGAGNPGAWNSNYIISGVVTYIAADSFTPVT